MKIECTYTEKEMAAIVLAHHEKEFPLPANLKWTAVVKAYNNGIELFTEEVEANNG